MGDPKFQRKKYSTPVHPWEGERIEEERDLTKEYGFKNKQEIWKMASKLKNFSKQAKKLIAEKTEQGEKETIQLLTKVKSLGLLPEAGTIEEILGLTLKDILERRLQSLVFRKGLSRSMKQARQFIIHEHIQVGGKKLTSPNFLVPKDIESSINFVANSAFTDEMHPERAEPEKMPKKPEGGKSDKKEAPKEEKKSEEKPKKEVKKEEKKQAPKEEKKKEEKPEETKK